MTAEEFKHREGTLPYRIHGPVDSSERLPLLVFLHGIGQRGHDNRAQLEHGVAAIPDWLERNGRPALVVAPQCADPGSWADIDWETKVLHRREQPTRELGLVLELLDELVATRPVDRRRIYLTGLSMGGYGTWDAIWRRPGFFAAAIPVCGGGLAEEAGRLVELPVWAFHGDDDTVVPPEQSRAMVDAIRQAGGSPRYTEYPGVGHDSWTRTYEDAAVLEWLFEQVRP